MFKTSSAWQQADTLPCVHINRTCLVAVYVLCAVTQSPLAWPCAGCCHICRLECAIMNYWLSEARYQAVVYEPCVLFDAMWGAPGKVFLLSWSSSAFTYGLRVLPTLEAVLPQVSGLHNLVQHWDTVWSEFGYWVTFWGIWGFLNGTMFLGGSWFLCYDWWLPGCKCMCPHGRLLHKPLVILLSLSHTAHSHTIAQHTHFLFQAWGESLSCYWTLELSEPSWKLVSCFDLIFGSWFWSGSFLKQHSIESRKLNQENRTGWTTQFIFVTSFFTLGSMAGLYRLLPLRLSVFFFFSSS